MSYLFTSESVSEGHPDKIADQISDALLDNFIAFDPTSKVALETLVTRGQVIVSGEICSNAIINIQNIVRHVIKDIGYTKDNYKFNYNSCGIISIINEQSNDINKAINKKIKYFQGAGDQGIVFGYANNETDNYIPLSIELSNIILKELSIIRNEKHLMNYLGPDSKSQVTLEYYNNNKLKRINTIIISTQHDEFDNSKNMQKCIYNDVVNILIPRVQKKLPKFLNKIFDDKKIKYYVNSSGKFVLGGPAGDSGLTGRKIIVDTYGGKAPHGGGAFSGKDTTKVDRSGAYAARHIAKNMVASGLADELSIQISYAMGIANPISIYVNTYNTSKLNISDNFIAKKIKENFDLRPYYIEKYLKLRNPIYRETSTYGHMGRKPLTVNKKFININGDEIKTKVELFTWEKLNLIPLINKIFKI